MVRVLGVVIALGVSVPAFAGDRLKHEVLGAYPDGRTVSTATAAEELPIYDYSNCRIVVQPQNRYSNLVCDVVDRAAPGSKIEITNRHHFLINRTGPIFFGFDTQWIFTEIRYVKDGQLVTGYLAPFRAATENAFGRLDSYSVHLWLAERAVRVVEGSF